ncbi:MAG: AAA family ATPase [Thermoplasmata archaeon]|nr:AAA family ATPase [Thermoplasmata archaeon]
MSGRVRRLVAVMLTDIVGYSATTQRDEGLALRLLDEHRRLVRPIVTTSRGHEVKTIGDAFLVEFESALDAVECAIQIQRALMERNRKATTGRIELRIGIHAGDVVHAENDVYGDAINIVSRITPLAEPGGVCVSGPVFEQVRNKIHLRGIELDSPSLKNIESPMAVYRLELPWQKPPRRGSVRLVGREPEVAILRRSADSAAGGNGRVVLLSGDAGIGKSRLAQEIAGIAEHAGFTVLQSRALPGELSAPYAPWVDLAREYLRNAPPQLMYRVSGNYGGEIVKLVPELAERIGPTPSLHTSGVDEARIRFFEGVSQLFQNIAKEAPLLVVVDDLHWADGASLRLLQYLARKLKGHRILLIGTFRETELEENPVLSDVLSDLNRERLTESIPVKNLGPKDVEAMVAAVVGAERIPPEFSRLVFEKTGGNPFFVEEVLQSLSEEGILGEAQQGGGLPPPADLRLPDTVRRVIRRRLSRVDAQTLGVLQVASILGYDFAFETLLQVSELPEKALLAGVESALETRVIEERRTSRRQLVYSFTDRQVHDLLYDEQSAIRRRKYHLKAARALETLAKEETFASAHELAYHYLEGNELGEALRYSLLAADRAEAVFAREDADRHLRVALEILDTRPNDTLRASILERLGANERLTGEIESSLRHVEEAAALLEKLGDKVGTARAYRAAGSLYANAYYDDRAAMERFERAGKALEGVPETAELGKIYLHLAYFTDRGLPSPGPRAQLRQALELGRRLGDQSLAIDAQMGLLWSTPIREVDSVHGQIQELATAIQASPPSPSNIRALATTSGWLALLIDEDSTKGIAAFQRGIARLRELGAESDAFDVQGQDLAQAYLLLGETDTALRLAEETYEFAIRNYPMPDLPNLLVLAEVARMRGDLERSAGLLERAYNLTHRNNSVVVRLAPAITLTRLHLDEGRPAEAQRISKEALAPFLESGIPAPVIAAADYSELLELAFEASSTEGIEGEAARYRTELQRMATLLPRSPIRAFHLEAEGSQAVRQGDGKKAAAYFEDSVEVWTALGWTPALGRTLGRLAGALRDAGDHSQSKAVFERAIETLRRIGATGDATRMARMAAMAPSTAERPRAAPADASP